MTSLYGAVFTFKFLHADSTNVRYQLSKTICDTKFIVDFQGQIGQKGQKGHLFSPVFFPLGARGDLACESCASSQETSHD